MTTKRTSTVALSGLPYLAVGLLVYMLIGDYTVFTWADPFVYIYAFLWPFVLLFTFLKWALIAVVVVVIVIFVYKLFND